MSQESKTLAEVDIVIITFYVKGDPLVRHDFLYDNKATIDQIRKYLEGKHCGEVTGIEVER